MVDLSKSRLKRGLSVFVMLLVALVAPLPALGHATFIGSEPANGSVLENPPGTIELYFDQPVTLRPGAVVVRDSAGNEVPAAARVENTTVVVDPLGELAQGAVVVEWAVGSEDGHPIRGSVVFYIGEMTEPVGVAAGSQARVGVIVLNVVTNLGLLVGAGLAIFLVAVHVGRSQLELLRRWSYGLLTVAALPSLFMGTVAGVEILGDIDVLGLPPGGRLSALLVVLSAPLLMVGAHFHRRLLVGSGLLLAAAGLAAVGHTRSVEPTWLTVAADMVHVGAGSVWAGGLVGLAIVHRRRAAGDGEAGSIVAMTRRFSRLAAWSLVAVGASGVLLGWRVLGSWSALFGTGHGRVVLAKVVLVIVVAGAGALNRFHLLPRLAASVTGAGDWLRRTVVVESAALALVIVLSGVLVEQNPKLAGQDPALLARDGIQFDLGTLGGELRLDPTGPGPNDLELALWDETGATFAAVDPPRVTFTPTSGSAPLTFDLEPGEDGYTASVPLPAGGSWEVQVTVRVDTFEEATASLLIDVDTGGVTAPSGIVAAGGKLPVPFEGAPDAVVYMSLTTSEHDGLVSVTSPSCQAATLHESVTDAAGVASMRSLDAIDLPAGIATDLTSGSYHIMCEGVAVGLRPGDRLPFSLTTTNGLDLVVMVDVVTYADVIADD